MPALIDLDKSKCTWCGDIVDSNDITDCDTDDCYERLCPNCFDPKTYGNYCDSCLGEYEPAIPRYPDNR